jgi:hypothetical protein
MALRHFAFWLAMEPSPAVPGDHAHGSTARFWVFWKSALGKQHQTTFPESWKTISFGKLKN